MDDHLSSVNREFPMALFESNMAHSQLVRVRRARNEFDGGILHVEHTIKGGHGGEGHAAKITLALGRRIGGRIPDDLGEVSARVPQGAGSGIHLQRRGIPHLIQEPVNGGLLARVEHRATGAAGLAVNRSGGGLGIAVGQPSQARENLLAHLVTAVGRGSPPLCPGPAGAVEQFGRLVQALRQDGIDVRCASVFQRHAIELNWRRRGRGVGFARQDQPENETGEKEQANRGQSAGGAAFHSGLLSLAVGLRVTDQVRRDKNHGSWE